MQLEARPPVPADGPADCRAVTVDSLDDLPVILEPDVNVVVLERDLEPAVAAAFAAIAASGDFRPQVQVRLERPETALALLADVEDPLAREALIDELSQLVPRYAAILDRRHVWAQLGVIRHDMCRKLHTDYVPIRLLCTYAGPGTEWVADADAKRENLQRIDVDYEEANRSVLRHPDAVRRASVGDVILLKGEAWPGFESRGAIHRSPPIEGTGVRRLLFKLDAAPCGC